MGRCKQESYHPRGDPRSPLSPVGTHHASPWVSPRGDLKCPPWGPRLARKLHGNRGDFPVGRASPGGHGDRTRGILGDPPGATGEDREISIYFTHLEIRSIFQDTLLEQTAPEAP